MQRRCLIWNLLAVAPACQGGATGRPAPDSAPATHSSASHAALGPKNTRAEADESAHTHAEGEGLSGGEAGAVGLPDTASEVGGAPDDADVDCLVGLSGRGGGPPAEAAAGTLAQLESETADSDDAPSLSSPAPAPGTDPGPGLDPTNSLNPFPHPGMHPGLAACLARLVREALLRGGRAADAALRNEALLVACRLARGKAGPSFCKGACRPARDGSATKRMSCA